MFDRRFVILRFVIRHCCHSIMLPDRMPILPPSAMPVTESTLLPPDLLAQLERLELVTRKVFRGRMKGERRSKRKGQSVEFADFRSYVPGDDLRSIDWNLYARLDKLIVKMFLEEEDLHFYTLIDASLSMDFGTPTKLQYAKQLAAALGLHRPDARRPRADRDARARAAPARAGAARPARACGGCSTISTASSRARPRRWPRA